MSKAQTAETAATTDGGERPGGTRSGLRNEYVSFPDVLAQSVANIAPSATPALVIPLVYATAGNGTWLAYLFATVATVLVGVNLNHFARRSASPGSLYAYIVKGLGPRPGFVSGWALILAYLLTASAVWCGFVDYAAILLKLAGASAPPLVIGIAGAGAAWYIAYKDIKLSARLMLAFEVFSLLLIAALAAVVLSRSDLRLGHAQLTLADVSPGSLRLGLVLAFFSFVGFESAASLGDEARSPLRSIPRAVTSSALIVGVFFVVLSFTEVIGFIGSPVRLNESEAPLAQLAAGNGLAVLGLLISVGAMVSFWACFLASVNAGARVMYAMGRHGVFHASVGNAHGDNRTPHVAVTLITAFAVAVPAILMGLGIGYFDIYGWVGAVATFGFLVNYALLAIAAPVSLHRENALRPAHVVVAAVTVLVLLIPIVGSFYPLPPMPYTVLPFLFAAWLAAGAVWFHVRQRKSPTMSADIEDHIETIQRRYQGARAAAGDAERN